MEVIHICGGKKLGGQLHVQGSKNAVLPILAATVLTKEPSVIEHCPAIGDVDNTLQMLREIGSHIERRAHKIYIENKDLSPDKISASLAAKMRSSIILSGALLSAYGYVKLANPGGCVIGARPIDMHLKGFSDMGAVITECDENYLITADRLHGCHHRLRLPSVGTTENLILAAVLAEGETVIEGAAREPEIVALCQCLKGAGALIKGEGSPVIVIQGVTKLNGILCRIPGDRIVAATYMCAVMAAGGYGTIHGIEPVQMYSFMKYGLDMGAEFTVRKNCIHIAQKERCRAVDYISTGYYPEFPTDMQSLIMVPLALAKGKSVMQEKIFENRFRMVPQLQGMGACVSVSDNVAMIEGVSGLHGAKLHAQELRGGAALVIAALAAGGRSSVDHVEYIFRGYENIVQDLQRLGADITLDREDSLIEAADGDNRTP